MKPSFISSGESRNVVIYLHGVGSGKEGWEAQSSATNDSGWRFIAVDRVLAKHPCPKTLVLRLMWKACWS